MLQNQKIVRLFQSRFQKHDNYLNKYLLPCLIKNVEKIEKKDVHFQLDVDRIINISLSHKNVEELCECKWFDTFDKYLKENPDVNIMLSTPNEYRKQSRMQK